MMTKLEAIIQPSRFEAVKEVLTELGIGGMTITDVRLLEKTGGKSGDWKV